MGSDELYLSVITIYYTGITNYLQVARQANIVISGQRLSCTSHIFSYEFYKLAIC